MAIGVLIVGADPKGRSLLRRVVKESFSDHIDVSEAGDLEAARRLIGGASGSKDSAPFKLMLIDLELPDGSGIELLTERALVSATKIVNVLSSDHEELFQALRCGADGYLLKGDDFEMLIEELQKIVRGQPPLSPAMARRLLTHFSCGVADPATAPRNSGSQRSRLSPLSHGTPLDSERLTPSESEVLMYLSKGFTMKEVANLMGIKRLTVNDHIRAILRKQSQGPDDDGALEAFIDAPRPTGGAPQAESEPTSAFGPGFRLEDDRRGNRSHS